MKETQKDWINRINQEFPKKKILVLGDVMVDEYVIGRVNRISPEAPIPVLGYSKKNRVAGGASNVANNLVSLGCEVYMSGMIGKDSVGDWLLEDLAQKGIHTDGFVREDRPTTVKQRFATKTQQLLRVDIEDSSEMTKESQESIYEYVKEKAEEVDAVILSDYSKGVLISEGFIQKIIQLCVQNGIKVSVDSKKKNVEIFADATFVKPNNIELEAAVGFPVIDDESLDRAGAIYLERSKAKALIVTRGANGISIFEKGKQRRNYASKAAQVFDVTGAGDTVISVITLALAADFVVDDAIILANHAAGIVISKVGTVPVKKEELVEQLTRQ